jgi:MFS family permease
MGTVLMCTAFNSYFYFTWYPTYLKQARFPELNAPLPKEEVAKMTEAEFKAADKARLKKLERATSPLASLVLAGGAIGAIGGGFLIDYLIRKLGNRHACRRAYCMASLTIAAFGLLLGVEFDSPFAASSCIAISMMCMFSTLAAWWGAVTDLSGRHIGALFGLMNGIGGFGAGASQLFGGWYSQTMKELGYSGRAQWDSIFYVYAGILALGAVGWLLINPARSVDRDQAELLTSQGSH